MPAITEFDGVYSATVATEIDDSECALCQNLLIDGDTLQLRGGTSKVNSTTFGADPIWGLGRTYGVTASPFWLVSTSTLVKSNVSGSFSNVITGLTANKQVDFVVAKGAVYALLGNSAAIPKKSTDGSTFNNHGSANVPKARIGLYHRHRLWLNDETAGNGSRLFLSDTDDPDTYRSQDTSTTATDGGYIDVGWGDGDKITALCALGSVLFIFKERSIWGLFGSSFTGGAKFTLIPMYMGVGTKSPRTVFPFENYILFLDSEGFVKAFHSPSRSIMSYIGEPIENVTNGIPQARMVEACAGIYRKLYVLSFAAAGQSVNNTTWVMDLRTLPLGFGEPGDRASAWVEFTGSFLSNAYVLANGSGDGGEFFFGDTNSGFIWQGFTGQDDGGAAIAFAWKSKAYGEEVDPVALKSIDEFATVTTGFTGALTHNIFANLATSATATKNITPGSAVHAVNIWKPGVAARGTVLQVGLSGSSSSGFECLSTKWNWAEQRPEKRDA